MSCIISHASSLINTPHGTSTPLDVAHTGYKIRGKRRFSFFPPPPLPLSLSHSLSRTITLSRTLSLALIRSHILAGSCDALEKLQVVVGFNTPFLYPLA